MPTAAAAPAAEDVAAADHQADLDAQRRGPTGISAAMRADHAGIEAVIALAHQRFAGDLQQDAAVLKSAGMACAIGLSGPSLRRRRNIHQTPAAGLAHLALTAAFATRESGST